MFNKLIRSQVIQLRKFSSVKERSFKILGLQQIAIGSLNKNDLYKFWGEDLGLVKVNDYKSEKENVDEDIMILGSSNKPETLVEVDLMQPLNPDIAPKVHIPALNHIGLWVDNIHNAVNELETKGIKFTPGGVRKGAAGYDVCFIHPKSAHGVLVELVQAPQNVIDYHTTK